MNVTLEKLGCRCKACTVRIVRFAPLICLLLTLLVRFDCFAVPAATTAHGAAKRVVVIKVDGLPQDEVDEYLRQQDARTGKSLLPWIEHVFYERGTRVNNFYVRGMSLSAPSWSLLDTGQHLQVKGNVEFDRFTLHNYDYLNFIPFYINNAFSRRVDMAGPEMLDELGVPLTYDAFPYDERQTSFQLFQRGVRWTTLERMMLNRFTNRSPKEYLDEWTMGFEMRDALTAQIERELIEKLKDPRIRYLDLYTTDYDHRTHHNRDRASHVRAMQEVDALVGRVWTAIENSPLADETVLMLVSDHGTNSDPKIYSQGFNLVKVLASAQGGGHHVITKRRLMQDYAVKGFYPLVPLITTTSDDTFYLKKQSTDYPTALLDFDGNERAAIHLRNNRLNVLHILLQQLQRENLPADVRRAATEYFFRCINEERATWQQTIAEMDEELGALRGLIAAQGKIVAAQKVTKKEWTQEERDKGLDAEARRQFARYDSWQADERDYTLYLASLRRLLALKPETFEPRKLKIEDLIVKGAMGDSNTIYDLQNYTVGLAPEGIRLNADGSFDAERSFTRRDYFALLRSQNVRNNVQAGVSNEPVDFIAVRVPVNGNDSATAPNSNDDVRRADEAFWLYKNAQAQSLILTRRNERGEMELRYLPVSNFRQAANGRYTFETAKWRAGLPLKIWEDAALALPTDEATHAAWLNEWHTEIEWLHAVHRTMYSNGIIGITEQLGRHTPPSLDPQAEGLTKDERLLRRFRLRQRVLAETDLLLNASNHWNFDVRGFNPGGNHGSFYRISTHSVLMLAGGARTGVPRALAIEEPYDSLSLAPTLFALYGESSLDGRPVPVLWQRGFRQFPGRIVREIFQPNAKPDQIASPLTTSPAPRAAARPDTGGGAP